MKTIIWWTIYTILGIWLQRFIPGLDCFAPALAGCLYLGLFKTTFWLTLIWIIIQEGVGGLAFGFTLLFYGGIVLFFLGSKLIFTQNTALFFIGASFYSAGLYFVTIQIMTSLQELNVPIYLIVQNSMLTLIFFPILWTIMILSYSQWMIDSNV